MISEKDLLEAREIINRINTGCDYVCFGAGRYFYDFIRNYCLNQKIIKAPKYVCDNNTDLWGRKIEGIEVVSPEKILSEKVEETIVVMSAVSPFGIMSDLQSLRLQCHYYCIIPLSQLETYYYYTEHQDDIRTVYDYLEDEKSRQNYEEFWRLSLRGVMNYSSIYTPNAYWNNDLIPKLQDDDAVIYAGAFDGKHIERALSNNENIIFHGFEPNEIMYHKLQEKYAEMDNVFLYPYALNNKKEVLSFDPSVLLGAMIVRDDNKGGVRVCSKLDKVNSSTIDIEISDKIDLIALDIEGSEIEALEGGQETIKKYMPKLGICVYHRLNHYVDVPLLIKRINPEYKLYFRHHSVVSTESVIYGL